MRRYDNRSRALEKAAGKAAYAQPLNGKLQTVFQRKSPFLLFISLPLKGQNILRHICKSSDEG